MLQTDLWILVGIGGLFILLGVGALFWGHGEKKSYYNALSSHTDVREYMEHTPERPEPGALQIGGLIAITIGVVLLIVAAAFWLFG